MGYVVMKAKKRLLTAIAGNGTVMRVSRKMEEKLPIQPKYQLNRGEVYIVFEKGNSIGFDILFNVLKSSRDFNYGLCFSREKPGAIKEKYGLGNTSFIWLTRIRGPNNLQPESLNSIAMVAEDFAKEGSLIYMEGLEYLIAMNGFNAVKGLIDRISDTAITSGATLVYSIDPEILEPAQKALLERFASILDET